MKQLYYTQEGQSYILKSQSKRFVHDFGEMGESGDIEVVVNGPITNQSNERFRLDFKTDKPIIPVQCCYGAVKVVGGTRYVDVMSVYYSFHDVDFDIVNNQHLPGLTKMVPCVQAIYYTSNSHYAYGIKYGQTVLSTTDFIPCTGRAGFKFKNFMADSFTDDADAVTIPIVSPATVNEVQVDITFLYFELQT